MSEETIEDVQEVEERQIPENIELHKNAKPLSQALIDGLAKIKQIVSEQWYFDDKSDQLHTQARIDSPVIKEPLAFVYPKDAEEIKAILSVANEYGIPIWPVGKGKNSGFGSINAAQEGCVMMVLERMNKILEVNETLAYAVVEPGVTFQDLHDYLIENKLKLSIDAIDGPADGSVLGNALERGRGGTNYGDHFSNLCGVEIILPNGDVLKTGGGPDHCKSWNAYKYGVGPSIDGLLSQGNYGIATKGGIWLSPKHECCTSIFFEIHHSEDFKKAIGIFQQLQLEGVIESTVRFGTDYALFSQVLEYPADLAPDGYLTQDALAQLRKKHNVGLWGAAASIYGTKEVVKVKQKRIKKALKGFGPIAFVGDKGADFLTRVFDASEDKTNKNIFYSLAGRLLEKVSGKELRFIRPTINIHNLYHRGVPTSHATEYGAFGEPGCPGCENMDGKFVNKKGIIWFAPVVPNDANDIDFVNEACKKMVNDHKFDYASGVFLYGPRSGMVIMKIAYDKENEGDGERAMALLTELHQWANKNGYQVYRPNVALMGELVDCAPVYKSFINKLKTAVDPNNILAPGKNGIG